MNTNNIWFHRLVERGRKTCIFAPLWHWLKTKLNWCLLGKVGQNVTPSICGPNSWVITSVPHQARRKHDIGPSFYFADYSLSYFTSYMTRIYIWTSLPSCIGYWSDWSMFSLLSSTKVRLMLLCCYLKLVSCAQLAVIEALVVVWSRE